MRRLTEVEKISWLSDQFKGDPRSQIQSCFVSSASSNESYSLIIEKLLRTYDLISENATEPHILYQNTLPNTGPPPPPLQNKYKPNNNYDTNKSANQKNAKPQSPKVDSRNSDKKSLAAGGFCLLKNSN